jgi:hypothetical protein
MIRGCLGGKGSTDAKNPEELDKVREVLGGGGGSRTLHAD